MVSLRKQWNYIYKITVLLGSAVIVVACDTQDAATSSIDDATTSPTLQMRQLDVNYTECGKVKMKLTAPVLDRYMLAPEPYSVFPQGFFVKFFTAEEVLESQITADYALYNEEPVEMWKAVGNVVVINYEKKQKLFTDTLYWDRKEHLIHTTAPVRIEKEDNIFKGRGGLTSDEKFSDYEIREVGDSDYYIDSPQQSAAADTLQKP